MNVSRPSTAAAGRTAGSTTCQNTRSVWQPSTLAESISSVGTDAAMYWRMRKTPNADTRLGAMTACRWLIHPRWRRSEEHTSELQSRQYLVCRLLLEKKNQQT